MNRWWPAVYVDGVPTEWWLIGGSNELLAKRPFVPGVIPIETGSQRLPG